MRTIRYLVLLIAVCSWPAVAGAAVNVTFTHPESYTDAKLYDFGRNAGQDAVLREIRQHLEQLGARYLQPDRILKLEILDVHLAGRYEPWRTAAAQVRFMRDITWPSMKMRYVLEQDGKVLASAEEYVADMNYLGQPSLYFPGDRLRYEKQMLDDWFRNRFARRP